MVIILALYVCWFRHLESLKGITPQLYAADSRGCNYCDTDTFFAAQYTVSHAQIVGQEASLCKGVLLGTSKLVRRRVIAWRDANAGYYWAVMDDPGGIWM